LLLLLLIYFAARIYQPAATNIPKAQQGVMDLRGWDFDKDGLVALNGEWDFYWNQLLAYPDFHNGSSILPIYETVPNNWNSYIIDENHLPGFGYATYRLKIKITDVASIKGLKITAPSGAYTLIVDNTVLCSNGVVSTNEQTFSPGFESKVAAFNTATDEFEIIIQTSNFAYARGGLCYSLFLGTDKQITALHEKERQRYFLLLGALFIMIIYQLSIFLLQKRYNYKAELYFVFIMILFALRVLFCGEYLICEFLPPLSLNWMGFFEYTTTLWALPALALFMQELYPKECSRRFLNGIIIVALFFTMINALTPLYFYSSLLLLVQCLSVAAALYYVYAAGLALIRRRSGAALLFGIIIFAICAFAEESLYHWSIIQTQYGNVFPYVSFVFIFAQSFILAHRSAQAFAEVNTLSQKLISLDKLKDDFMANTSHELRTPLHGMITITESVLASAAEILPQHHKDNLALVVSSGRRLANLVNDILDYEKLKHGDINLKTNSLDIQQVIPAILEVSRYLSFSKPLAIVSQIPDNLPPIEADENRFIQIVYNLLGNAIRFTEQGMITISAIQNKNMVEISVTDTGIGIPPDKLDDIFKSFEQLDAALSSPYGGTGLGLSVTKYLVEIQGGQIWLTSSPGQGSTFTFSLPASTALADTKKFTNGKETIAYNAPLRSNFKTPTYFPQTGEFTVLLVDDDYVNLQALNNIMVSENYSAIAVANGQEALDVLSHQRQVDLVILDIMLPGMSGYEICRKLRENYSLFELPVLMMTAQNSANSMIAGFAAGANDFLAKPFDPSELKARMKTLLQLKKSVNHAIQAEMAFLLAQIKPHFLYNALNTIMSFCWTDAEKAGQLLLALSQYLRGSFNFNNMNQFIPLENELEFVESYLAIEKARFEEKLNFQFDIAVPLDFMVPTLVIQPLVENAIKHGILPKQKGGTVFLSVTQQASFIFIKIEDNGVGMTEDKLTAILADSTTKSVGLMNINKRLKRIYGYGFDIVSKVDAGTIVSIKLPCERKEI